MIGYQRTHSWSSSVTERSVDGVIERMLPDSATLRASSCFHDRLLHGLPRRWINLPFVRPSNPMDAGRHTRPSGPLDQRRVTSRRRVHQSASSQGSDHAHRATPAADAGDGAMSATRKQSFAATARLSLSAVMLQCITYTPTFSTVTTETTLHL